MEILKQNKEVCKYIGSVQFDYWTDPMNRAFGSLNYSYINSDWEVHSMCIACGGVDERHTAENLAVWIRQELNKYGIEPDAVFHWTPDGASNGIKALRDGLDVERFNVCYCHQVKWNFFF